MTHCPHCGWPDAEPFRIVSSHRTRDGQTTWSRCSCGSLQVRVAAAGCVRIVARGRPA